MAYTLNVNGTSVVFDVPGDMPLLWALRDIGRLTGTKFGCGIGLCGACTVHVDGQAMRSCSTPISAVADRRVTTIEGVGSDKVGKALQDAWIDLNVPQCGYCQPGQIMTATALLRLNPRPTDEEIGQAMNGNLCRCGAYARIRGAIKRAADSLGGDDQ